MPFRRSPPSSTACGAPTQFPDFAIRGAGADRLTVRHLLEHSSGIPDVTDYAWEKPDYDVGALRRFVATLRDSTLQFAPGSAWDYSNTAYEVLGRIIEVTTREIFESYMTRKVLRPAGMRSATWLMAIDPLDFVTGHIVVDSALRVSPIYPYNRRYAPSSTLHANVTDGGGESGRCRRVRIRDLGTRDARGAACSGAALTRVSCYVVVRSDECALLLQWFQ